MPTSSKPVRPQTDPWYLALFKKLPTWLKVVVVILVVLGFLGVGYVLINGGGGAGAGLNF